MEVKTLTQEFLRFKAIILRRICGLQAQIDNIGSSGSGSTIDAYTKTESDAKYLTGYSEGDPTVPTYVKAITQAQINAWQASYPNSNPSGYISGITNQQVTTALGFTPLQGNGTAQQYIAGNGTKATFPTIPADNSAQVTNNTNAIAQNTTAIATNASDILAKGINYVNTYAEMTVLCTGASQKTFVVKSSEINSNQQTMYTYDGAGGIYWVASTKIN